VAQAVIDSDMQRFGHERGAIIFNELFRFNIFREYTVGLGLTNIFPKVLELKLFFKSKSFFYQLITFATLLAIWAIVLRDAFSGDRLFSLYEDNEFLLGPVISGISHMYLNGVMPLRLDTILGGFPLYNFTQITPYYPFYGFGFDIYNGYLETVKSLHWLTLLHLLLLLVNMNVLLRSIGVNRISAISGAALFTFSADLFVYATWLNVLAPYSWLPLYIAGILGILRNQNVRKSYILALMSMLMIVTSAPSQPLIYAVFLTIFICIGYIINCFRLKLTYRLTKPLLLIGVISILCFLVCAPILLSAQFESGKMIRWIGKFPAIMLNEKIPFDAFVYYKFPIKDFWQLFFYHWGGMVGSAYVGFFAIPLAMFAFLKKGNWLAGVFLLVAVYALLSSFGDDAGFAYINYKLPLIDKIREPSQFLVLFQFSMTVLMSMGLSNLSQEFTEEKSYIFRGRYLLSVAAFIICGAFAFGIYHFSNVKIIANVFGDYPFKINASDYVRFYACLTLIGLTFFLLKHGLFVRRALAFIWAVATLAALFTAVQWKPPLTISDSRYVTNNFASLDMAIAHVAELDPDSKFRLFFDGNFQKGYAGMLASYRGVRTYTYYINPAPVHQAVDFSYEYSPYYAYEGAAFLICKQCNLTKYKSFKYVKSYGDYGIYFDSKAYPRVYIGKAAGYFSDTPDFISKVKKEAPGFDRKVYLEKGNPINIAHLASKKDCKLSSSFSSAIRQDLIVDCDAGHIIVLNEFYDGNWVGYDNGVKVNVFRVNGNQNGIALTSNSQFVTFEYRPSILINSLALSLLGLVFLISLYFLI
jgi:hypothetical protein